ncbi:hypothetical protein AB9M10_15605 [Rhodococcus erythropolis]
MQAELDAQITADRARIRSGDFDEGRQFDRPATPVERRLLEHIGHTLPSGELTTEVISVFMFSSGEALRAKGVHRSWPELTRTKKGRWKPPVNLPAIFFYGAPHPNSYLHPDYKDPT